MLKTNKKLRPKKTEEVCLAFLAEAGTSPVRQEISLMSDGSAFQARGPAMENALSVT